VYTNAGNAKIKGAELDLKSVIGGGPGAEPLRFIQSMRTTRTSIRTPTFRRRS